MTNKPDVYKPDQTHVNAVDEKLKQDGQLPGQNPHGGVTNTNDNANRQNNEVNRVNRHDQEGIANSEDTEENREGSRNGEKSGRLNPPSAKK